MRAGYGARALSLGTLVLLAAAPWAQADPPSAPAPGSSCTISAVNRNAPVAADFSSFTIYNIPGSGSATVPANPFRARVTCSDGTVGQTAIAFPELNSTLVETGPIFWGVLDAAPVSLQLKAPSRRLTTGQTGQLTATAIAIDGSTRDVTPRSEGTSYFVSNPLLASITQGGLLTVLPLFAPSSTARVVVGAISEGGVSASHMFVLGPRGSLRGKVTRADGTTGVPGAQVSVLRHQPMEQAGTVVTDGSGDFELLDVNAGSFTLTTIDPGTGDRGKAFATLETEGQSATADVRLNGQGTVVVTVLDTFNNAVSGSLVTLTALGAFLDTRTGATGTGGQVTFERVAAGDFTVSTRDRVSGLLGTALGLLPVNGTLPLTLKLQPIGTIQGVAYGIDGSTLQEGTQVRILSRERGIVTQAITGPDGAFRFNPLPLSDGPFTLDAFADGRLRARVPGLVLSAPNQVLTRNLTYSSVGTVSGLVSDASGQLYAGASVTLQMTEGLRFAFDTKTDATGRFFFPGVPVGNFTLTAAKDGRTGTTPGRVNADNESVALNVQLATNSLIGTVYERDGATPAAGVTVYLVPSRVSLALTINPSAAGVLATTTSALGQFGFPIPTIDSYTLQAESGAERGRTQVVITTIDPAHPVEASLAFLAKGTVTGVVKDAAGAVQAGAAAKVSTRGAFNNAWDTVTGGSGRYTVPGVFVGDVTTTAQNTVTRLAGASNGRLLAEGETLTLDVTLAATGRVTGQVLRRDGSVLTTPVRIELSGGGTIDAPNGSGYEFDLVPVGDFTVTATETATGDKGISSSRINAAGEVKVLNVRLVGQGTVNVRTVDEVGAAVPGAQVTVRTSTPFSTTTWLDSDASGDATLPRVPAGDFTVTATKAAVIGTRSGSGSGTLIANGVADVTITLVSRPLGSVTGTLRGPDGITPRAGAVIRLTPEPAPGAYRTVTDAQGRYEFPGIEGGTTYAMNARLFDNGSCNVDRIRAQATGIRITGQGEVVERDLQMIGAGAVSGHVVNGGGTGVGGIRIRLTNPDPVYGRNGGCGGTAFEATSASDGSYSYPDIPAGNFTIIAENAARTLRAEGNGRVRFDGDEVTVDLELVDNAVTMPYTLLDANTMPFDVAGDGSVLTGKNQVFSGSGTAADSRGMRLEVVVGGVPVPFLNGDGTIGRLAQSGRELQLDELNVASQLKVTRKIFVPRDGYFARYLETLENTTSEPITVGLRVVTRHRGIASNARVVDSSDGDQILSVLEAENRDRWLIVDDQQDADPFTSGGTPATGHVFDGGGGAQQVASAGYELVGTTGKLTWQWDSLTVPPGRSVAVMHFVFHQLDRFRARQAALRLGQMPPEALEGLTTDERESIVNFPVPADGSSPVGPLPAVSAGVIQGHVFSGDGVTPIPFAPVHFKSRSVLFGRVFNVSANAQGAFEFRARTDGSSSAIPIPLYTFDIDARHPKTSALTSNSVGDFVPPETVVTKDLIFNDTGNLRGTVRRHSGGLVEGAFVQLCTEDHIGCPTRNYDTTQANGTYLMSGSPPRDYFVYVQKSHPQGSEPLRGRTTTTVTGGDTAVADVVLESTGTLSGLVHAANGDPVANAPVTLYFATPSGGFLGARSAVTDTAGRYRFFDVRVGGVRVDARDPVNGAEGTAPGAVAVDEESFVDVTLRGFGTVDVEVHFARGVPAPAVWVSYSGERGGSVRTDGGGRASVSLPVGHYNFSASHPDEGGAGLGATALADLLTNGQVVPVAMTLKAAGAVRGTIVRPDGSTLAGGFPYTVRLINGSSNQVRSGQTSSTGVYRTGGLVLGLYLLTAYDPQQNRFADQEFQITADGEEVQVDLRVEDNRIVLPANLFDANRFRFDVQRSGALDTGHGSFDHGGLALEVNGQAFVGDTSALLEAGKRQFALTQEAAISGLKVTRKVFVPRGAYFARYLEVLENPTSSPITAEAVVTTKYAAAQVTSSSSGDTGVTAADEWVVFDDANTQDVALAGGQQPATSQVFGQAGAAKMIDGADYTLGLGLEGTLVQRWGGLVVPPGGKVVLMHFAVQQVHRAGAAASAQRLVQLPPEAIQSLTESEIRSIVNFSVPADGTSVVAPLPPLTASISGRVFEGDGVTATSGVRVSVRSAHPLFNRIWGLQKDPDFYCPMAGTAVPSLVSTGPGGGPNPLPAGTYSLAGRLTDTDSIALPEGVEVRVVAQEPLGCFGYYAGHSFTHIPSREYRLAASGATSVIFDSGILTGTVTGYADYQVTGGRMYLSVEDPDPNTNRYVSLGPNGTYTYPGMTPGTYDVLADTSHPQGSGLRGAHAGAVVTLGFTTVTDVQLQPAGAVQGAVLTANGEASVNARVQIASPAQSQTYDQCPSGCVPGTLAKHKGKLAVSRETRTDSLGRYGLSAVPPGAYSMTVTDPISDAKKTVSLTVTADQVTVQNVILLPVGSVLLTVRLPSGAPAVDALVYLLSDAAGFEKTAGRTDGQGRLTVSNIPQGGFTIRVRDPRQPNDSFYDRRASGTINTGGEQQELTITLLASATLRVTTTDGDKGNVILAGSDVYLQDARSARRYVGASDAQGVLSVAGVPEGAFVLEARKSLEGAVAVVSIPGTVVLADDAQVKNVAAQVRRTLGSARATVVDKDTANTPIANADIYLTDALRFRGYRGRTDAAGQFLVSGIAVGPFTVTARATISGALQEAEASGTITAANIAVTQEVRPEFQSTIVPLPRTIYDANQFPYDVQPNGAIGHGRWSYYGAFNTGASILEVNGVPFTGASQARLEAGTRQLAVTQRVAGLDVTRKVFVPRGGYFARYLEIFENRSLSPVTVDAKVTHKYHIRTLTATSSGDAAAQAADEWATVDDTYDGDTFRLYYDEAATAHVNGQAGSGEALDDLRFENDDTGYYTPGRRLVQAWNQVTVPEGGRVILMHFVVQEVNRAGSRAAAERLVQLPPEAIDALTAEERAAVRNFNVPADGVSVVAALPALTARVEGKTFEGDHVTLAKNAEVQVKSLHPLFGRTWTTYSGNQGEFAVTGQITDTNTSVPIPAGGPVQIHSKHGLTQLVAPTYTPSFADGATVLSQDVVFPSGPVTGRILSPADYPIRGSNHYVEAFRGTTQVQGYVYVDASGNYTFPGLEAGTYRMRLTAYHNQGSGLQGTVDNVTVTVGVTTTADLPVQPTGSVAGTVKLASGLPAGANHHVTLTGVSGTSAYRSTYTNAQGVYTLTAVPVGRYDLVVTDARNGARVVTTFDVGAGQSVLQDVMLPGTATVQLTARFARGVVAPSAGVYLTAPSIQGERWIGYTNSSGRIDIAVPAGTYTLRATHPRANYNYAPFDSTVTGTVETDGQSVPVTLTLKAVADVRLTVVNADNGNLPVPGAQIRISDARGSEIYGGNTNGAGQLILAAVPEGAYSISARLPDDRAFGTTGSITTADDGLTVDRTISATYQFDVLGAITFTGERRLYAVSASVGDVLSVTAYGNAHSGRPELYLTRTYVYDPDKALVASGYKYYGAFGYRYSDLGDLANIPAEKAGPYTIAIESYWPSDPNYLGAFRLIVAVNGVPVPVGAYPGGSVEGRVLKADGATPSPLHTVALKTLDVLALHVRTVADESGQYRFDGVPLGDYRVAAVDADLLVETVSAQGTLPTADVVTAPDLVLPARSEFTIEVQGESGSPYAAGVPVEVTDAAGQRSFHTNEAGQVVTTGYGLLTATASYGGLSGAASASAVDGQAVSLTITLVPTSLSGFVLEATDAPRADQQVDLYTSYWDYVGSTVTGADGSFLFENVPAGIPLRLITYDPDFGVEVTLMVTVPHGQRLTGQVLRFWRAGSVRGRVQLADGTGLPNFEALARFVTGSGSEIYRSAYTDADGWYLFENNLPVGMSLRISASDPAFGGYAEVAVTIDAAGETALAPPLVLEGNSLRVRVQDAAGNPVQGDFLFYMDGSYLTYSDGSERIFVGVGTGPHHLELFDYRIDDFIAITDAVVLPDATATATFVVSLLTGTVHHTNGDPVTNGSVYIDTDSNHSYYANIESDGRYAVAGVTPGDFTLSVSDDDSGFYVESSGTMPKGDPAAVTLDVTLPPSGKVTVVFRDGNDQRVTDATVFLRSSGLEYDRYLYGASDADGNYVFPHVALGTLTVEALDPATSLVTQASGVLGADEEEVTVDLQLAPASAVSGLVVESGGEPVPGAVVRLESVRQYGLTGTYIAQTTTEVDGSYLLSPAPAGAVLLSALHPDGQQAAARSVTLAPGATLEPTTLTMGTGARFDHNLDGQDGFRYDVGCQGTLTDGGTADRSLTDAYDGAYYVAVNGQSFPCFGAGLARAGGREVKIGPTAFGSLLVSRRIFVPAEGGYVRFLDEVTNESGAEVTVPVEVASTLGSWWDTRIRVAPADVQGRYAVTADSLVSPVDPPLAHVFFDNDPLSLAPARVYFQELYPYVGTGWDLTIPAGETRSIMTFGVQRPRSGVSAAQAQAEGLSGKSDPHMLDGLSAEERARIRNFTFQ